MKLNTRQLTHAALLVAVSIILTRLGAVMVTQTIRLSFGHIPIYMGGLLFGPLTGGMVGAVADLLGYLINSFGGAFVPQIFLASVMRGIVPPLVLRLVGNNDRNWHLKVVAAIIGAELVSGVFLTTWGLSWLFGTPFLALLPARLVALAVQIPVYAACTYILTAKLRYYATACQAGK
jgi:ECF transporter S component (folate family)